jgi:hypothetical protein
MLIAVWLAVQPASGAVEGSNVVEKPVVVFVNRTMNGIRITGIVVVLDPRSNGLVPTMYPSYVARFTGETIS